MESGHYRRCLMREPHGLTGDCHPKASHTNFSVDLVSIFMNMWMCILNMHIQCIKSDSLETSRLRVSSCFTFKISYLNRPASVVSFQTVLCFKGALVWMTDLFWIPQVSCNCCNLMGSTLEKSAPHPSHFIILSSKGGISSTQGTFI